MTGTTFVIGVVAPAAPVDPKIVDPIRQIAADLYGDRVEVRFHPNCFLSAGHFAGEDAERAAATIEIANSPDIDAIWFGRGGYGTMRVAPAILGALTPEALAKPYLGYSDLGVLMAGLYNRGAPLLAHGPMVHDLYRPNGIAAVTRALRWLVERSPETLEPGLIPGRKVAAFNLTVLCHLIGTWSKRWPSRCIGSIGASPTCPIPGWRRKSQDCASVDAPTSFPMSPNLP